MRKQISKATYEELALEASKSRSTSAIQGLEVEPRKRPSPAVKDLHELVAEEEENRRRLAHEKNVADLAEKEGSPNNQSLAQAKRRADEKAKILEFAVYCLWKFKPDRESIASLADLMDQRAHLFCQKTGALPLGRERLLRMLREAVKLTDK